MRQTSSALRVLKNVSTMALSKQFPLPERVKILGPEHQRVRSCVAFKKELVRTFEVREVDLAE